MMGYHLQYVYSDVVVKSNPESSHQAGFAKI